jgi:two-component system NtrC family sensor kinase
MALLSAVSYLYFSEQFKQSVAIQQQASLRIIAEHLDGDLRDAKRLIASVASTLDPAGPGGPGELALRLGQNPMARDYFDGGFILLDPEGRRIADNLSLPGAAVPESSLADVAGEAARTGKSVISAPRRSPFPPHDPAVIFATPVAVRGGRPTALLLGFHDLLRDPFLPYIGKVRVGKNGFMYVVHADRTIILHPDPERILGSVPPGLDHGLDLSLKGFDDTLKNSGAGGVRELTSFRALSEANWTVLSNLPLAEAYAPLGRTLAVIVASFLSVSAILVCAVWLLSRKLTAPLVQLAGHVRAMPGKSGDDRRISVRSGDEVELLADAFNGMTEEIDARNLKLSEQRHFLENLLGSTSTPLFVIGPDHKVLIWNRAIEELTGIASCDVVGTDGQWRPFYPSPRPCLCDLVLDGEVDRVGSYYDDHSTLGGDEGIIRAEGWYRGLGGKDRYIFFDAAPVRSPDGRLLAVVETLLDITKRKEAEATLARKQAELQEKHEQLSSLFEKVSEGKYEWEQTTDAIDDIVILVGKDGAIRRCNKSLAHFLGVPYTAIIGENWRDLLSGEQLDLSALDDGGGERFHAPSGRWLSIKVYPYRDDGSAVVALHDLTEIKRVSEELAAAYKQLKSTHVQLLQQEKMASIGQLAAGVAHEINNPIGFIKSNLGTLVKYVERLRSFIEAQGDAVSASAPPGIAVTVDEARKRLKIDHVLEDLPKLIAESSEGTERVRVIVQNLKSFSRVDEAERQRIDLNGCLESAVTIAWNELKYKATLVRDLGDLPPVACYPQKLNQVFLNLLVNAAHAIENRGEVTVRSWRDGDFACVSVGDTGQGIPAEILNRIFEPFFTTKEIGKGTGLGLSISYDIVTQHGGTIAVESEPGRGATFTVRLPIGGAEPA